ncbi:hypothetical protein VAE130_571480 [Vibrio aestuarianus]|uniref:Uncharacterized protein n=1 Tax=Vibrio aestuarianus TaxID=28171 RepID=A0ABM9FT21_9VIBR|nr:hypothetical protein VAE055_380833 [Vibrio aestuarianus]CAH8211195.1 hypothetical protein VAE032_271481 [Vibrio aestuarianus]CAH8211385.1 hypothetical protein VAE128_461485 [Vibrio aestuarianus]CAH8211547.1 hypothetical protein VAE130_571480 [Vibrio aestuarianus]CAH8219128.1 hypothetical protein VAE142_891475 [Vibrio aestuarianus]
MLALNIRAEIAVMLKYLFIKFSFYSEPEGHIKNMLVVLQSVFTGLCFPRIRFCCIGFD